MRVLFAPVKFGDGFSGSWGTNELNAIAAQTRAYYLEASYGRSTMSMDITIAPFVTIAQRSTAYEVFNDAQAKAQLAAIGIDAMSFDKRVYLTDRNSAVGYKGLQWGVGNCWVNCMGSDYALHSCIHELGHSIGLPHPAIVQSGVRDGSVVRLPALGQNIGAPRPLYCKTTVMGYEAFQTHFTAGEKARLGWIAPVVHPAGADASYTLTPLAGAGGTVYAVRVLTTTAREYWIEYRTQVGFDSNLYDGWNGILVSVMGEGGLYLPALIVPDSRANLLPGESMNDGGTVIECTGVGQVRVYPATTAPPPPPPPPPPPTGNTQMLLDTIKAEANALVLGAITQEQVDQIKADVGQLVADAATQPPPVSGTAASVLGVDVSTHGNWRGVYGSDGYWLMEEAKSLPSYAAVTYDTRTGSYPWPGSTTETRALQKGSGSGRVAACWYGKNGPTFDVAINVGAAPRKVTVYCLDWDGNARSQRLDVLDAATLQVLATKSLSSFHDGAYVRMSIAGSVILRVTKLDGANAVISGLFFDPA